MVEIDEIQGCNTRDPSLIAQNDKRIVILSNDLTERGFGGIIQQISS